MIRMNTTAPHEYLDGTVGMIFFWGSSAEKSARTGSGFSYLSIVGKLADQVENFLPAVTPLGRVRPDAWAGFNIQIPKAA